MSLSNDGNNFITAKEKTNILFAEAGEMMVAKTVFRPEASVDYSPWYDHVNYLSYAWKE